MFIAGHVAAHPIIDLLPEDTFKITVLREPVERIISHYNYFHWAGYYGDEKYSSFCKSATLERWLTDRVTIKYANRNLMTRFFNDMDNDDLETAKQTIDQYDVIGILNNAQFGLQHVIDCVADEFHLCYIDIDNVKHRNITTYTQSLNSISEKTLDRIKKQNQNDILLFKYVCEKLGVDHELKTSL